MIKVGVEVGMTLLGDHVITSSLLYRVLIADTVLYLPH